MDIIELNKILEQLEKQVKTLEPMLIQSKKLADQTMKNLPDNEAKPLLKEMLQNAKKGIQPDAETISKLQNIASKYGSRG